MAPPIAFKEWQVVCDALASGRQSVILRKGGIHEGRQGFSFAHESFFLFPTRFHTLADHIREGEVAVMPEWKQGDTIRITHYAEATWAVTLTDWEKVAALEPLHIYSEQTVRDRFNWESGAAAAGSIHLAPVRIRKLAAPWELSYEPKYGGCRSWISLPAAPANWEKLSTPVVGDREFEVLLDQLKTLIDPAVTSPNQTAPF